MGLDVMVDEVKRKKNGKLKKKEAYYWRRFTDLQEAFFDSWCSLNEDISGRYAIDAFNGVWIELVPQVVDDLEASLKKRIEPEIRKYQQWSEDDEDNYDWEINHWKELDRFFRNIRKDLKKGKRFVYCCSW